MKYLPDSYHVGIRLQQSKVLPSLAIYILMVSFPLHLKFIRSQLGFRVGSILTFILYILFGLQIQRESLLKRLSQKMSDNVYLSLHFY